MLSFEYIIVYIIITLSVVYLGYRAYLSLKDINSPCQGCSGCALKAANPPKKSCNVKKEMCNEKKGQENL